MEPEIDAEFNIDDADLTDVADPAAGENGEIDWATEGPKYKGIAQRRTTALKKAKEHIAKPAAPIIPKPADPAPKKGDLDYGQKAFLNSLGFKDAEDQKYVQQTMKDTGKSLEEVIAVPFVAAELKRLGEERATKAAIPAADGGRQGAPARNEVDYWLNADKLPPVDQVELRRKVVKAKIAKEKSAGQFTQTPVVGQG